MSKGEKDAMGAEEAWGLIKLPWTSLAMQAKRPIAFVFMHDIHIKDS